MQGPSPSLAALNWRQVLERARRGLQVKARLMEVRENLTHKTRAISVVPVIEGRFVRILDEWLSIGKPNDLVIAISGKRYVVTLMVYAKSERFIARKLRHEKTPIYLFPEIPSDSTGRYCLACFDGRLAGADFKKIMATTEPYPANRRQNRYEVAMDSEMRKISILSLEELENLKNIRRSVFRKRLKALNEIPHRNHHKAAHRGDCTPV